MRSAASATLEADFGEMEAQLLGPSSTLLERLAVQRVVVAWHHCQQVDRMVALFLHFLK